MLRFPQEVDDHRDRLVTGLRHPVGQLPKVCKILDSFIGYLDYHVLAAQSRLGRSRRPTRKHAGHHHSILRFELHLVFHEVSDVGGADAPTSQLVTFVDRLLPFDRGDGNCDFAAVAQHLRLDGLSDHQVRDKLVEDRQFLPEPRGGLVACQLQEHVTGSELGLKRGRILHHTTD